jgi:hypothetical protein
MQRTNEPTTFSLNHRIYREFRLFQYPAPTGMHPGRLLVPQHLKRLLPEDLESREPPRCLREQRSRDYG